MGKRRRFTLMPIITLAALSLMVTVPALSSMQLHAAAPQQLGRGTDLLDADPDGVLVAIGTDLDDALGLT